MRPRLGAKAWVTTLVGVFGAVLGTAVLPASWAWVAPEVLAGVVIPVAAGCVLASLAVLVVAGREGTVELWFLGTFLMAVSWLPLAHGLTVPGVLVGENPATAWSVAIAAPLGLLGALPLVLPATRLRRWISRHAAPWCGAWLAIIVVSGLVLMIEPHAAPEIALRTWSTVVPGVVGAALMIGMSRRYLGLYRISRHRGSLVTSLGLLWIAASLLVWLAPAPYSVAFWLAHALDAGGVLLAAFAATRALRRHRSLVEITAPAVAIDPLSALDLGLDPVVRAFVDALDDKDRSTREHVVRTAHVSGEVARRMRLTVEAQRAIVLGGLMHDIGKLLVPDALLRKPGRLAPGEYEVIKRHATDGEALVRTSPVLADIAPIVRHHHERFDGQGYPDGLTGEAIPIGARIVATADAFDALANTRHYRDGLGPEVAMSVLHEHAGAQWDPQVVRVLPAVVECLEPRAGLESEGPVETPSCLDALPPSARAILTERSVAFRQGLPEPALEGRHIAAAPSKVVCADEDVPFAPGPARDARQLADDHRS